MTQIYTTASIVHSNLFLLLLHLELSNKLSIFSREAEGNVTMEPKNFLQTPHSCQVMLLILYLINYTTFGQTVKGGRSRKKAMLYMS